MRRWKKWWCLAFIVLLSICPYGCGKKTDNIDADMKEENIAVPELAMTKTEHITEDSEETSSSKQEETTETMTTEALYLQDLEEILRKEISNVGLSGNTSVYVQNLSEDAYAEVDNRTKQSASLIKLYVAGCVYEQKDILASGETYAGETEDLIKKMITASDNDATNTLVTRLGRGDSGEGMNLVNAYCEEHGFTDTSMGRLMLDFSAQTDNYTSAKDCAHFLQKVYNREITGSDNIFNYLKQQERTAKIPAGVPEGIETANKTGELEDVENDAAIVLGTDNIYVICIMMDGLSDTSIGRDTMVKMSSDAYTYFNNKQ